MRAPLRGFTWDVIETAGEGGTEMYQINATEMMRERQAALLREAEERRLARRLRARRSPRTQSLVAGFRRAVASWGETSIPFFRA